MKFRKSETVRKHFFFFFCGLSFRFVFLLDESGPDFDANNAFYAEQLRKQLFVNVYKDGKWATIARNFVKNTNVNASTTGNDRSTTHINSVT